MKKENPGSQWAWYDCARGRIKSIRAQFPKLWATIPLWGHVTESSDPENFGNSKIFLNTNQKLIQNKIPNESKMFQVTLSNGLNTQHFHFSQCIPSYYINEHCLKHLCSDSKVLYAMNYCVFILHIKFSALTETWWFN